MLLENGYRIRLEDETGYIILESSTPKVEQGPRLPQRIRDRYRAVRGVARFGHDSLAVVRIAKILSLVEVIRQNIDYVVAAVLVGDMRIEW